jgi:hypothetical protein
MTRKLSTNQKLAEFLNKSEIQDDEAEAMDHEERRARERLRVTSLYGAGARFKTPKTKVTARIAKGVDNNSFDRKNRRLCSHLSSSSRQMKRQSINSKRAPLFLQEPMRISIEE